MALIGAGKWPVDIKVFNGHSWPGGLFGTNEDAWSLTNILLYSGQGFNLPLDETWINRSTGTSTNGGIIMGFPRSAEPNPEQAGNIKWYVTES